MPDIFSGVQITDNIKLKNRLVRSATNDHLGNRDGSISDAQTELYARLSKNGPGMIITGHFGVDENCRADPFQGLVCDRRYLPGLRRLSDAVHDNGGVICAQISHAGLRGFCDPVTELHRERNANTELGGHSHPVDINQITPDDVQKIADQFAFGAKLLEEAGFDCIQLHMAHNYFLHNVLDNTVNKRTDQYGGDDSKRFSAVQTIINTIKQRCSSSLGLLVKISVNNNKLEPRYLNSVIYYLHRLESLGIDAVELSGSDFYEKTEHDNLYYLNEALLIKKEISTPLILTGGICSREEIMTVLDNGIELVGMSRAFIADDDFASKLKEGVASRSHCQRCMKCLSIFSTEYRRCMQHNEIKKLRENFS